MASHRAFPKSAPSSPMYELRRAHGQAPAPNHQKASERQRLLASPRSLADPLRLVDVSGSGLFRTIPNGAEQVRDADARLRRQVPRSHGLHQLSNQDLCPYTGQPSLPKLEPEYELYPISPRKRLRVSLENTLVPSHKHDQPSHLASDEGLAHTGSWCHLTPIDPSEAQLETHDSEEDVLIGDWYPRTPIDTRMSTPDLPPLSTDYEFCPCHIPCEHRQDKINEDFYFATRSKMDIQSMLNHSSSKDLADCAIANERSD
ncbi:hypothetical protein FGSG_07511 [Fusarium graminearum PH-1]|uniref:Uncharacterized protein n=1 Tax=Gibberella zeae (strain ATCC MYA-4620 / CBS 123657 / FGSC 9075 / NRRL 31084 / PH-1) TaxID=229533 RepID=I1RTK2_GIBZE|nr:hypothetical protein FGSG_07511 [Fusarium graminearum PH-1]ESU13780.1 hypothetical protein FGSG_07511 [Fusarium graminearum PH-1]|eukprot:XP_011327287.1 hypothetical protein FGSG_07511 [Fusarium graminearum PH-1]